jgi:hypothetical protein
VQSTVWATPAFSLECSAITCCYGNCFRRDLFEAVGSEYLGFDDFRRNGLLLPASGESALRLRLPLHRGPHRSYNELVAERVGQIEHDWSRLRHRAPEVAGEQALMRLELLQRALRRRLLAAERPRIRLNLKDPLGADSISRSWMRWPRHCGTSREVNPDTCFLWCLREPGAAGCIWWR